MPVFKQNPKNKYKAKTVKRDGVTYRSEAEADRNTDLRGLHRAGEVVAWFRQVKVRLADSVDYTADFLVISGKPGGITTVHLEDVKGVTLIDIDRNEKTVKLTGDSIGVPEAVAALNKAGFFCRLPQPKKK